MEPEKKTHVQIRKITTSPSPRLRLHAAFPDNEGLFAWRVLAATGLFGDDARGS